MYYSFLKHINAILCEIWIEHNNAWVLQVLRNVSLTRRRHTDQGMRCGHKCRAWVAGATVLCAPQWFSMTLAERSDSKYFILPNRNMASTVPSPWLLQRKETQQQALKFSQWNIERAEQSLPGFQLFVFHRVGNEHSLTNILSIFPRIANFEK